MKTKVLVTGHTGFIGSALMDALIKETVDFAPIGISRSDGGDLSCPETLKQFERVDRIVHLAGRVGVMESWSQPLEFFKNNLVPTLNVLEFARVFKIPVIYLSSYVYGQAHYLPMDEAHPIDCRSPYARSKRQAEMLCEAYAKDFGVPVTLLRPFNIYGPAQRPDFLIPSILWQVKMKDFVYVKDLRPKRDCLYIDDLTDGILRILRSPQNGLEIYNIGFGKSYSVEEIVRLAMKVTARQLPVTSENNQRKNEIMDCSSNSKKFSDRFGWKPRVDLEDGIVRMLNSMPLRDQEVFAHEGS